MVAGGSTVAVWVAGTADPRTMAVAAKDPPMPLRISETLRTTRSKIPARDMASIYSQRDPHALA